VSEYVTNPRHSQLLPRWIFLRLLGIVYLAAFGSLWFQVDGLIGSQGIVPVDTFFQQIRFRSPSMSFWNFPTLSWLSSSDQMLHGQCIAGLLFSLSLILGRLPLLSVIVLWGLYLSLSTTGNVFFEFQWDTLLLEAGLLSVLVAPHGLRDGFPLRGQQGMLVSWEIPKWLFRWLLFRLIFLAGVVKLTSGDPSWRYLSALEYHFQTQPLPVWTSWYAHQLPLWIHHLGVLLVFIVELLLPWFIFGSRKMRKIAFVGINLFQIMIAVTGNYGFFNFLTSSITIWLLDDGSFGGRWSERVHKQAISHPTFWQKWIRTSVLIWVVLVVVVSGEQIHQTLFASVRDPGTVRGAIRYVYNHVKPFRSINRYGLFAVMTTRRDEIVIEGSIDGHVWKEYEFFWKPGVSDRRPAFTGLHMPRLDWRMWFAALRSEPPSWYFRLVHRLLEGSSPVDQMLYANPFSDQVPRFIRGFRYEYRFARSGTSDWWRRDKQRSYGPVMQLDQLGNLREAKLPYCNE